MVRTLNILTTLVLVPIGYFCFCNSSVPVLGTFQNVHIRSLGIGSF
jgi:hypothetical protein